MELDQKVEKWSLVLDAMARGNFAPLGGLDLVNSLK
jgi:hypothetical protein